MYVFAYRCCYPSTLFTQILIKMEKLELKHLAPYLPYGLLYKKGNKSYKLSTIIGDKTIGYDDNFESLCRIDAIKPILRPLSELKIFENDIMNLYDVRNPNDMKNCLYDIERVIDNGVEFDTCYAFVNWMFQNHFDVFDLIPKGLAMSYSDV